MPDEILLEDNPPSPFLEYEVEGVGTVIAPEGEPGYRVRLPDGRVTAFPAQSGEPCEENAAADIAHASANPVVPKQTVFTYDRFRAHCDARVPGFGARLLTAARGNVEVDHWINVAVARNTVHLDSPELAAALALFVSAGLMTAAERTAILTP